jgi:O-antigen ligase
MYAFFILIVFSLIYNYPKIESKIIVTVPLNILIFLSVYHISKNKVTPLVIDSIINAIVILSLFCALLAIYQLLIDSNFLKICPPRIDFGSFVRSSAIFNSEYELGYILNFSIIIFLVRYKNKSVLYIALPLLIFALFSTFHRLNWIIFVICMLLYAIINKRFHLVIRYSFIFLGAGIFLFLVIPEILEQKELQLFIDNRLLSDSGKRFIQYKMALEIISNNFFGLGGYNTKEYYNMAVSYDLIQKKGIPHVVHNGFLAIAVKYGVLTMLSFIFMVISMFVYFAKKISFNNLTTTFPYFIILIWLLSNLTNSITQFNSYFEILIAIICGSFISLYKKTDNSGKNKESLKPNPGVIVFNK